MTVIPFIEYSLYQMFLMFCVWSFIGWGIEVCYMTLETGEYQNRGFLNMPICPIYGFGVLMVVVFFRPLEHTIIPLFVVTALLCTTFELLVGLGMEKLFNTRWWDYSHEKFNFKGYICLKVSLLWGFGCVIVVKVVHPAIEAAINWLPVKAGMVIIVIMSVLILIDLITSICAVNNLNNRLKQLDEISALMLKSSVKIGEKLASGTNIINDKYEKFNDKAASEIKEKTSEIKEKTSEVTSDIKERTFEITSDIKEKYDKLIGMRDHQIERLLKAYPSIRSLKYSDAMDKLKEKLLTYRLPLRNNSIKNEKPPDASENEAVENNDV